MELEHPHQQRNESYQHIINQQKQQIRILKQRNQSLQQQLNQASRQSQRLKRYRDQDPLHNLFQQFQPDFNSNQNNGSIWSDSNINITLASYKDLQRNLAIYRQRIKIVQEQKQYLQNRIQQKQKQLKIAKITQIKLNNKLAQSQRLLQLLTNQESIKRQTIQKLKNQLNKAGQQLKTARNQLLAVNKQSMENQQTNSTQIQYLSKQLNQISSNWIMSMKLFNKSQKQNRMDQNDSSNFGNNAINRDILQKFKRQDQVMEEMGKQIQIRNEQIKNLSDQLYMKNPNYQIKQENFIQKLTQQHNYSSFVQIMKKKQSMYTQLLKQYKKLLQTYESSQKEKQLLQKQYETMVKQNAKIKHLKQDYEEFKSQLESYKNLSEKLKQQIDQSNYNMECLLKENQSFHKFMYQQYGSRIYQDKIDQLVREYQGRMKERQIKEKWGNVSELIIMNRNLKEKLVARR